MKSEAEIRQLLYDCQDRAREANSVVAGTDPMSAEYQQAMLAHLVWINVEQAMRWVLDELEAEFTPVQVR